MISRARRVLSVAGRYPWLLLAVVPISAALLGSVPVWALAVTTAMTFGALGLLVTDPATARWTLPIPAYGFLALAVWTLIMTVPLPLGIVDVLSPRAADVWRGAYRPFDETLTVGSVSLDPGASRIEALKLLVYASVFTISAVLARHRGRSGGLAVVYGSALFILLATLGHGLTGAEKVWGFHRPSVKTSEILVGPLVNLNCLGAYLNLGAFCGLGLALTNREQTRRVGLLIGSLLLFIGVVFTQSRGAVASGLLGIVVFCVLARPLQRQRSRLAAAITTLGIVGVSGLALLVSKAAMQTRSLGGLLDPSLEKLRLIAGVAPLVRDYRWLGVGRGAFEGVFAEYAPPSRTIYSHPENLVMQWVSEWGLPLGLLALAFFAWALRPSVLGVGKRSLAAGAWTGMVAFVAQNMVDLSSEVPAVPIALFTALGACWGAEFQRRLQKTKTPGPTWRPSLLGKGAVLASACAAMSLAWVGRHTAETERRDVFETTMAPSDDLYAKGVKSREALRMAIRRHPADPYFPLVGAEIAAADGIDRPIPWLQRALERGPRIGNNHFALAQVLAHAGHLNQALFELKLAATYREGIHATTAETALQWTREADGLIAAAPEGEAGSKVLLSMARNRQLKAEVELRQKLLAEAVTRSPNDIDARSAYANDLLSQCAAAPMRACIDAVTAQILSLERMPDGGPLAGMLRARLLEAQGHFEEAEALLDKVCATQERPVPCLELRVKIATHLGTDALRTAGKAFLAHACGRPDACANAHDQMGNFCFQLGSPGLAIEYLAQAAELAPTSNRWARLARTAEAANEIGLAISAYDRAASFGQETSKYAREASRLRSKAPLLVPPSVPLRR